MGKYLESFAEIRSIHEHLVERAHKAGVPVIENGQIEVAIGDVMELVLAQADRLGVAR